MSEWKIKGPWYFVKHNWEETSVYDADRDVVCSIRIHSDVTEETQDQFEAITAAKAVAIAALPELLDALEAFMETYKVDREIQEPTHVRDCWALAESALLKAQGGGQ